MAIVLIRYPAELARLDELRTTGLPRLLLVDEGAEPPEPSGTDEDWIRLPVDGRDLTARILALEQASQPHLEPPVIDESNLLHHQNQWVALPLIEARLATALIEQFRSAVSREKLIAAAWPDGEDVHRNVLDVHMLKLRRRIEGLGLSIHTVRGHGYLLDVASL